MSDRVTSYLRTAVPVAWGWLITQAVAQWPDLPGYVVDALSTPEAVTAVTAGVTFLWYVVWRAVEDKLPAWATRLVLGSNSAPVYTAGVVEPLYADRGEFE